MKNRNLHARLGLVPLALVLLPFASSAQVPVDDDGNVINAYGDGAYEKYSTEAPTGNEGIPLLAPADLEDLVGPIALYPDDLLAVVLPAASYPLQVVQAARFLEDLEADPSLKPDPDWDDSIVALINYPEVVELLNEDLDWTWRLGEAVVAQQADVLMAVEQFRNRAYAAGNLTSDSYQTVSQDEGYIEITPVNEEIIYVPYYEPTRVVHYQSRPVYHYYPQPCPVYYYPYPSNYNFHRRNFWGVTTAFTIGWTSNHLRVFHHSYNGHPYFGARYWNRWWYRRPTINVHNHVYINNNVGVSTSRYSSGDNWRPSRNTRLRYSDQRITRNVHNPRRQIRTNTTSTNRPVHRNANADTQRQTYATQGQTQRRAATNRSRRSFVPAERDPAVQPRDRAVQPRDRAVQPRDRAVQPRDRAVQPRDRVVQPRGNTGISNRRQPSRSNDANHSQRAAIQDERRRESLRTSSRPTSATTARRTQPAPTSERRIRPTPAAESRPQSARSTERRSQQAPKPERGEQKSARRSSSEREVRRRN